MITTTMLIVVLVPLFVIFVDYAVLMELYRNRVTAANDARYILEDIRDVTPFTNSNVINNFPEGIDISNRIGNTRKLMNETIVVTYANPAADPLTVTVTVNWIERRRNRSFTLSTLMTQR